MKENLRCGWWRNLCRASVTCTPKEFVNTNKYFWEKKLLEVSVYKKIN
jgi:hypothetical protein